MTIFSKFLDAEILKKCVFGLLGALEGSPAVQNPRTPPRTDPGEFGEMVKKCKNTYKTLYKAK